MSGGEDTLPMKSFGLTIQKGTQKSGKKELDKQMTASFLPSQQHRVVQKRSIEFTTINDAEDFSIMYFQELSDEVQH